MQTVLVWYCFDLVNHRSSSILASFGTTFVHEGNQSIASAQRFAALMNEQGPELFAPELTMVPNTAASLPAFSKS